MSRLFLSIRTLLCDKTDRGVWLQNKKPQTAEGGLWSARVNAKEKGLILRIRRRFVNHRTWQGHLLQLQLWERQPWVSW